MGMELGTPALLTIGAVVGLAIGLALGLWRQHQPSPAPATTRRDHQYHDCPGCGGRIVRARTYQHSYRFFDAEPRDIEKPPEYPDLVHGRTDYAELMRRNAKAVEVVRLNNELWVFDPWDRGAMVPYWQQPTVADQGLLEHFCALGVQAPPADLNEGERVPWTTPSPSVRSSAA